MEILERRLWNKSMLPLVKRRGLVSTSARRWIEFMIRENEAKIAELLSDNVMAPAE